MKIILRKTLKSILAGCVGIAFIAGTVQADGDDVLSEVAQLVANMPIGARLDPSQSRRCFVAVQLLLDEQELSNPGSLPDFLEQVCHAGISSELERQGIFHLFAGVGIDAAALDGSDGYINQTDAQRTLFAAIQPCWNIGAVSTSALQVSLRISFEVDDTRRPITSSINLLEAIRGSEVTILQMFESVRRAVIRCGANGFPTSIDADQYELVFSLNPQP